jgi:hypothetical protein
MALAGHGSDPQTKSGLADAVDQARRVQECGRRTGWRLDVERDLYCLAHVAGIRAGVRRLSDAGRFFEPIADLLEKGLDNDLGPSTGSASFAPPCMLGSH